MHLKPLVIVSAVATAFLAGCAGTLLPAPALGPQGPSSSQTPYLIGKDGWTTTAIMTVGDATAGYRMAGIADGLGAYLNDKNELVLLMNHEFGNNAGIPRAHGAKGSFVSQWRIDPASLKVLAGQDLIKKAVLKTGPKELGRMCSADLPAVSAFYNPATGRGTMTRIFLNGEENGPTGRALAHIANGPEAGTSYELTQMKQASWENVLASPFAQDQTVVIGLDDTHPKPNQKAKLDAEVGKLYLYVGNKTNTGNEIDKAGLSNGTTRYVQVGAGGLEGRAAPLAGRFTLTDKGGTNFLRPEDGHWDVKNPNVFYFLTTDRLTSVKDADGEGRSRLYKMTFDDIKKPMAGGKIEALLNGTEGYEMLDNMTVSADGTLILQEDVGGNPRLGKIWHFDPSTRKLSEIAVHDAARFTKGAAGFLTEDEESSGVIEVTDLLTKASRRYADGRRYYLLNVQAHYATDAELVEGGQLVLLASPKK